jgi:hypothetical protein
MWDVLIAVILMGFGAVVLITVAAMVGWVIFWMQNGGKDD